MEQRYRPSVQLHFLAPFFSLPLQAAFFPDGDQTASDKASGVAACRLPQKPLGIILILGKRKRLFLRRLLSCGDCFGYWFALASERNSLK
jgi:hypothetical protein